MNATPPPPPDDLNDEIMTRWMDGELSPAELDVMQQVLQQQPHLQLEAEREATLQIGNLLRTHLPSSLEPHSPDFFTSRIMEEIHASGGAQPLPASGSKSRTAWFSFLKQPWFAPLASAAAVAVVFLVSNGLQSDGSSKRNGTARVYAPDSRVTASAYYSESAEATVIELQGLEAVPDDREIRAYDLAGSDVVTPGAPRVFHAANNPGKARLVLSPDGAGSPRIHELD